MKTVSAVGGSRDGERKVAVGRGRALLMASALRVVIQQRLAGPCASCLLNQTGNGGAGAAARHWSAKRGECDLAQQAGAPPACDAVKAPSRASPPVDLAHHNMPAPSL